MIGYLNGSVINTSNGTVLLLVNGVGYEVVCSSSAYTRLVRDKEGGIYTYMAVREDGVFLYGFDTPEEKNMFMQLISVSGVGPKMGITVLSNISLQALAVAIASNDCKTLSKIKGLGKKTAERIILELREKVGQMDADGEIPAPTETATMEDNVPVNEDAVLALMAYGFNRTESVNAVKRAVKSGATSIEDILLMAIRGM